MLSLLTILPAYSQDYLTIVAQGSLPQIPLTSDPTTAFPISVRTSWNLTGLWGNVYVCMFMSSPMKGTGNNPDTITATSVQVNSVSIVSAGTNCGMATATQVGTGFVWFGGGTPAGRMQNGYRTDTVNIRIAGFSAALEPDTYTGTITLVANAQY